MKYKRNLYKAIKVEIEYCWLVEINVIKFSKKKSNARYESLKIASDI